MNDDLNRIIDLAIGLLPGCHGSLHFSPTTEWINLPECSSCSGGSSDCFCVMLGPGFPTKHRRSRLVRRLWDFCGKAPQEMVLKLGDPELARALKSTATKRNNFCRRESFLDPSHSNP